MNNKKMGQFISELRKSNQMTQKDLASKLNITDKAVSKWERGLSCPDISLLSSIADILGVTTSELLNGEKNSSNSEDVEVNIDNALQYADKNTKSRVRSLQNIFLLAFSVILLIGIIVCAICDIAISGTFTWSLYPISSIIFAWLVFLPIIKLGRKGFFSSMVALSILVIPFLFVLNKLIKVSDLFLPVGIRCAAISIAFIWIIFVVFKKLRTRKLIATSISLLLAIPIWILMDFSISKMVSQPLIDIWDLLGFSIIAIISIILFSIDFTTRKSNC